MMFLHIFSHFRRHTLSLQTSLRNQEDIISFRSNNCPGRCRIWLYNLQRRPFVQTDLVRYKLD